MPDDSLPPASTPVFVQPVAPDLETLLDLETAIDQACRTLIEREEIEQVAIRRGVEIVTSKRVDVFTTLGACTGTLYVPANEPEGPFNTDLCFERCWQARISLNVVTARALNDAFHALYRARVRSVMLRFATLFTTEVLPYHALSVVRSVGAEYGLLTQQEEDYSRLDYSCLVSVRDGAWPAPYGEGSEG